jgi:ASC-1-like (ASCH) protein
MPVAVVDVRIVWMAMHQRLVCVRMAVRLLAIPGKIVVVLVMLVVVMAVRVYESLVRMFMRMAFADMQPDTHGHQRTGQPEGEAGMLAKQQQ